MAPPALNIRRFKGLRYYYPKSEKAVDELSIANNVLFDREGVLVARPGIRHTNLTSVAVSTVAVADDGAPIAVYPHPGNSTAYLIFKKSNRLWLSDGVNPYTEIPGAPNTIRYMGALYDERLYMADGIYYGSTGFVNTVVGMPSREVVIVHKDRIWSTSRDQALTGTVPYRVYFSEPGAAVGGGGWPAANFIDVRTGAPNRAMESYRDSIYIFKPNAVWVLNTGGLPANWTLRQLGDQGCLGGTCVYNNVLYWVGENGVYSYNGVAITRISEPIQTFFDENVFAYDDESQIVGLDGNLFINVRVMPNLARQHLVYNITRQQWTRIPNVFGNQVLGRMLAIESGSGVTVDNIPKGIYFGTADNQTVHKPHSYYMGAPVYKDKSFTDVETDYTVDVETGAIDFDAPLSKKRIKFLSLDAQFTDLTVNQIDEEGRSKSVNLVGQDPTKVTQIKVPGLGYFRRLRIKLTSTNFPSGLKFLALQGAVKEHGRESATSAGTYSTQP